MLGRRLFRALLLLYPRWFREDFGAPMLAEFEASRRRHREESRSALFWPHILADFLQTAARAWTHTLSRVAEDVVTPPTSKRQLVENVMKDFRIALRGLFRKPGAALVAILALGLGIGLTAGMFSIVNGVILKGLPVDDPHELMAINRVNPSEGPSRLLTRIHDYEDLRERQTTFEDLAAYEITAFNLGMDEGTPEFANGANVTVNTFALLHESPMIGRDFQPGDEVLGASPVTLIGHRFWQERFGGDPGVLGRTVRLDGRPTEIIGVMPEGFEFPFNQQVWRPLPAMDLALERGAGPSLLAFGRLPRGSAPREVRRTSPGS